MGFCRSYAARRRRRPSAGAVLAVVIAILVTGVGVAAVPTSDGTIEACYDRQLRLRVEADRPCAKDETPLAWPQSANPAPGPEFQRATVEPGGTPATAALLPGVGRLMLECGDVGSTNRLVFEDVAAIGGNYYGPGDELELDPGETHHFLSADDKQVVLHFAMLDVTASGDPLCRLLARVSLET